MIFVFVNKSLLSKLVCYFVVHFWYLNLMYVSSKDYNFLTLFVITRTVNEIQAVFHY